MTILSETTIREVHYVLHQGERYGGEDIRLGELIFCVITLYAVKDGYGLEVQKWDYPKKGKNPGETRAYEDMIKSHSKILGVIQNRDGQFVPVTGYPGSEFFGEKPYETPCGRKPHVCATFARQHRTGLGPTPMLGSWSETTCACGVKRSYPDQFPSPDWATESGAG